MEVMSRRYGRAIKMALALTLALCLTPNARAQVPLEGYVIANKACEAYQSKNKLTNPGNVITVEGFAYDVLGINKPKGDFFLIQVPDAPVTERRWLSVSCGVHVLASTANPEPEAAAALPGPANKPVSTDNLLALSWQPAFCETRPAKPECRDLNAGLLPVTSRQLSIHGLWPQPRGNDYCGVPASIQAQDTPANWHDLPAPEIDLETADILAVLMPGVASGLEHHEWIKHGTCYFGRGGADEYFDDTIYVTNAINASAVVEMLTASIGREISGEAIRDAFDQSFGDGAGDRISIKCANDGSRVILTELWINLKGEITPQSDVGTLIRSARPASPGCQRMVIDPPGLQ